MWASKFNFCRNTFLPYRCLIKTSTTLPKAFINSEFSGIRLSKSLGPFSRFSLFKNASVKLNLQCMKVTTIAPKKAPISSQKIIGIWLLCSASTVYGAILLGGFTRLTESGLSMVTWRFTPEDIPRSEEEWIAEFEKYKQFPEFKLLKRDLTLEDFKFIWKNEYFHRTWGRIVGAVFAVPALVFWYKGWFLTPMKKRIGAFSVLIISQGLLGWYMVKSGLEDKFHKETDVPRVSQYRLAAHLGLALTLYTGLLWTALDILLPPQTVPVVTAGLKRLKMLAHSCKGLVFLTALSGAFVAGLDAGLVYNSFPKMGDKWIPDDILALSPIFVNFTENPTTVQFDHRILGISTFSLIMATWLLSKKHVLPGRAKKVINSLAVIACCQVALGITTLVRYVPLPEALTHQSGSVLLLSFATWLAHELKNVKYIPK